jgi:hypothetical protein
VYKRNFLGTWTKIKDIRKPIVGAVSGFAVSRRGQRTSGFPLRPKRMSGANDRLTARRRM